MEIASTNVLIESGKSISKAKQTGSPKPSDSMLPHFHWTTIGNLKTTIGQIQCNMFYNQNFWKISRKFVWRENWFRYMGLSNLNIKFDFIIDYHLCTVVDHFEYLLHSSSSNSWPCPSMDLTKNYIKISRCFVIVDIVCLPSIRIHVEREKNYIDIHWTQWLRAKTSINPMHSKINILHKVCKSFSRSLYTHRASQAHSWHT